MADIPTPSVGWRINGGSRAQRTFSVVVPGTTNDVDVTGWAVDAKIRTRPGGDILHTFPADRAVVVDGQVQCTIPGPVSRVWAFTTGWYRIEITDPDSPVDDPENPRVLQGPFVVDPS